MKTVKLIRYDAFADTPGMGNPCGVVFDDTLTPEEMQAVAAKAGFTECAFLCPSETADLRLRFFMPGKETPLCGHGTVCAISAFMAGQPAAPRLLSAETGAGILSLGWEPDTRRVVMEQANAQFEPFEGDLPALMAAIGLGMENLDPRWPVLYGSTGAWTVILPICSLEAFGRMQPQNKLFASILTAHPGASVHPICTQVLHPECTLHGRHFSSSSSGTVEDPVTGTACGVMAAYYLAHMPALHGGSSSISLLIEQGQDMGLDGKVQAWAEAQPDGIHVKIAGSAIPGKEFSLTI